MSLGLTKLAVGVDCDGEAVHLTALARRFRRYVVIDELRLPEPLPEDAAAQVAGFLDRHRLREARLIACLPRQAGLVRILELPAEAEPQLAKVVGYQLNSFHPFKEDQVLWDFSLVGRDPQAKQISVLVAVAEKSRANHHRQALQKLGLRLSGLTLGAAVMAPLVKPLIAPTALIVCGRSSSVELLSFRQGALCASQAVPLEPIASAGERFEREWHRALAALPVSDAAAIPCFVCGSVPAAISDLLQEASPLPAPKLNLTRPRGAGGLDWPTLAAANAALSRDGSSFPNLLPSQERWQPQPGARAPAYALGATAALLAVTLASHAWIERALYGRLLDHQLKRLEVPAEHFRSENQEAKALDARAAVLETLRAGNWQKLRLLGQLTKLLPDGTWLQELHINEDTVEIFGVSDHAADLVPPLENSAYFTQVEFTSPITRDNQNKEVFRIRMRLKQAAPRKD